MICVDEKLIKKELESQADIKFKHLKMSNSFLSHLFEFYDCHEMCENFYDREPEVEDELYDKYFAYQYGREEKESSMLSFQTGAEFKNSSSKNWTEEELKEAYFQVKKMYKDFESERIKILNWQEPYFEGNWGLTQAKVNKQAKIVLKQIKKTSVSKKKRLYYGEKDDFFYIYFYGRDFMYKDYWMIWKKKPAVRTIKGYCSEQCEKCSE